MRGRLLNPFLCEIAQLDTVATAADPDGAGPLESGYDDDFREPVRISMTGEGPGVSATVYKEPLRVRAQVEVGTFQKVVEFFSGNSPDVRLVLVLHFSDLEDAGMVDVFGSAGLRIGDRLDAIYDLDGNLVQTMTTPVYLVQAEPSSFGLGKKRNLLIAYFEARTKGVQPG